MAVKSFFEIENQIEIAVNDGKSIDLVSYSFSDDIEKKLNSVIFKVLGRFGRNEMAGVVYTIIKELAINGTKANIKYLFLAENGYDSENDESYHEGMSAFRSKVSEAFLLKMGIQARDKGLWVKIHFKYSDDGLTIYVRNNMALSHLDERRIREKLGKAMRYNDIAEFYLDNADETEGAGMGIALVIILLKAENIDPGYFRVYRDEEGITTARVEIPFNEAFVSARTQN